LPTLCPQGPYYFLLFASVFLPSAWLFVKFLWSRTVKPGAFIFCPSLAPYGAAWRRRQMMEWNAQTQRWTSPFCRSREPNYPVCRLSPCRKRPSRMVAYCRAIPSNSINSPWKFPWRVQLNFADNPNPACWWVHTLADSRAFSDVVSFFYCGQCSRWPWVFGPSLPRRTGETGPRFFPRGLRPRALTPCWSAWDSEIVLQVLRVEPREFTR